MVTTRTTPNLDLTVVDSPTGDGGQALTNNFDKIDNAAIIGLTATPAEINQALDGISGNVTAVNLNELTSITASAAEINQAIDGVSVNVTAINLSKLTNSSTTTTTTLHNHKLSMISRTPAQTISSGNVLIPVWVCTDNPIRIPQSNWWSFLQDVNDSTRGVQLTWVKYGPGTIDSTIWIRGLSSAFEGKLVPAYWWPFTATSSNVVPLTTGQVHGWYRLDLAGRYASYTVGANSVGHDTATVYFYGTAGGGTATLLLNGTTVGSAGAIDTNESGVSSNESWTNGGFTTFTLPSALRLGDVLRIEFVSGVARIEGLMTCLSTGTWTSGHRALLPSSMKRIISYGSAIEYAQGVAPTGQATKWMGTIHSASGATGTDCGFVSVTETWTKNGSPWTPATGYTTGFFQMNRTATVQYALDPVNIGTTTEQYILVGQSIGFAGKFTASAIVDAASVYIGMLPADRTNVLRILTDNVDIDVSTDVSETVYALPANKQQTAIFANDTALIMKSVNCTVRQVASYLWPRAANADPLAAAYVKAYLQAEDMTGVPIGSGWAWTWNMYLGRITGL